MRKVKEYFHMIIAAIICITVRMISGKGQAVSKTVRKTVPFEAGKYKNTALSSRNQEKAVVKSKKHETMCITKYSPEVMKHICGPGDLKRTPLIPGGVCL